MITQGTEKQIAFATKIRAGLLARLVGTKMVAADKIDAFAAQLDTNTSTDAAVWIDTAKSLNAGRDALMEDGWIACDPRKFLPAITVKAN